MRFNLHGNHFPAHHWHFVHFKAHKELRHFYLSIIIRTFALSLITIFTPIYLIKEIGFSFQDVILFNIVGTLVYGICSYWAALFCSKLGAKFLMLMTQPFFILYFILLYYLKFSPNLIWNAAIISGFADGFFWIAYHSVFSKSTDISHRGEEVSLASVMAILISILAPVIGGLVAFYFNFLILFVFVGAFLILSIIPLFFGKEVKERFSFRFKNVFNLKYFGDILGFIGHGAKGVGDGILWPLFLFLVLKSYVAIGGLASLSGILAAFVSYIVGILSDKFNKRTFIMVGGFLNSISWFIRHLYQSVAGVSVISFYSSMTSMIFEGPIGALVYDKLGKHKSKLEYLVFRQISLTLGMLVILGVVYFSLSYKIGFIIAGIGSLMLMFF